tara:strand:- start:2110 stop:2256 length:147 start_codon:yes stop_codon:yes gene_type:complete
MKELAKEEKKNKNRYKIFHKLIGIIMKRYNLILELSDARVLNEENQNN